MLQARSIGFPGYRAGLSNQRMALEIAVAVAHLTGRKLALYGLPMIENRGGPDIALRITDLMEIPVPWTLLDPTAHPWVTCRWPRLSDTVLVTPGAEEQGARLAAFAHGRPDLVRLAPLRDLASPAHVMIEVNPLSLYSYAFYLDAGESLFPLMTALRPRKVYRTLAQSLAERLGQFDALHLRLGDFLDWSLTPRAEQVSAGEILRNLEAIIPPDAPLVVLSDDPDHPLLADLLRHFPRARVFERWLEAMGRLPGFDRPLTGAEMGLVAQMVAARSRHFVGTMCSTFTALIHRARGARVFMFAYNMFPHVFELADCVMREGPASGGAFSWQRLSFKAPFPRQYFSWFREWPEAI